MTITEYLKVILKVKLKIFLFSNFQTLKFALSGM